MKKLGSEFKELRAVRTAKGATMVRGHATPSWGPAWLLLVNPRAVSWIGILSAIRYLPSGWNLEITAISRDPRSRLPLGPDGTKYEPVPGNA